MTMTFEQDVLTAHDFVVNHTENAGVSPGEVVPESIYQDDYDDSIQKLALVFPDKSVHKQVREWDREEFEKYDQMARNNGFASKHEQFEYINSHSQLKEDLVEETPKTVADAQAQLVGSKVSLEAFLDARGLRANEDGTLTPMFTLESLQQLSMELSIALNARELMAGISGKLRGLMKGFSGYLKMRQFTTVYNFQYNRIEKAATIARDTPYAAVARTKLNAMRGQNASYVDVLNALILAQDAAEKTFTDSITSLKRWLGGLSSSHDLRQSIRDTSSLRPNLGTGDTSIYAPVREALARCIVNRPEVQHQYSLLFKNHTEWFDLLAATPALLGRLESHGPAAFNQAIEGCVHLIDHLISIIDRQQDQALSREVAQKIGEVVYAVAQEVEFCAAYNTLVIQFCNGLSETADHFIKTR